jgi:hypothetical protein
MDESIRLLSIPKSFPWSKLTPSHNTLLHIILGIRRRMDYIVRLNSIDDDGFLTFSIRDARMVEQTGSAKFFVDELSFLSGGAIEWHVHNEGMVGELIAVRVRPELL